MIISTSPYCVQGPQRNGKVPADAQILLHALQRLQACLLVKCRGKPRCFQEFYNLAKDLGIRVNNNEDLAEHIHAWFESREEKWLLMNNLDSFEDVYDFIPRFWVC